MTAVGPMAQYDAIVVGAGIVGAACARALANDGRRVLVLDARYAASGATAAGMGHLVVMDDGSAQLALTTGRVDRLARIGHEGRPGAGERIVSGVGVHEISCGRSDSWWGWCP